MKSIPQQFKLQPRLQAFIQEPDYTVENGTFPSKQLSTFKIYVTENDSFLVKFQDIFNNDDYIIDFTTDADDKRWEMFPIKFWQCQVNFAVSCASNFSGISQYHMFDESLPNLVRSVMKFHFYFTIRKILSYLECPLPGDDAFRQNNNHINLRKFDDVKRQYNVPPNFDFRMWFGMKFNKKHRTYSPRAENGFCYFIPKTSTGLLKEGLSNINDSIRNYVILILASQVESRSQLIGKSGKIFDARTMFLTLFETSINQSKSTMISDDISRFQDYVTKAKIHLNYVLGPQLYLISDNLSMNLNSHGYNNQLIVGRNNQHFGVNQINQTIIPRVPLMQGSKPKIQLIQATQTEGSNKATEGSNKAIKDSTQAIKVSNNVIKDWKVTDKQHTHSNVKIALFFLTSFVGGVILYAKNL